MTLLFLSDNDTLHEQNLLLLRACVQDSKNILYACPTQSSNAEIASSYGIPLLTIPKNNISKYFRLRSIIKKNHIKLVHVFDKPSLKLALLLQKTFCPIQIIMSHHDRVIFNSTPPFQAPQDYAIRAFLQNKLLLLFVSSAELYTHLQTLENSTRLRLLPYCIDFETTNQQNTSHIISHNLNNRFIFLVNTPLVPQSGLNILIEAFSLLPKELDKNEPIVELHILGSGSEFDNLLDLAHELNVQDTIAFLGVQDPMAFTATSHAIICPAIGDDGDYVMILHAWRYHLPLIASDLSVHTKMAITGSNTQAALIYSRTSPESLAKCMATMVSDKTYRDNVTGMGAKMVHNFEMPVLEKEYTRFTNKYS